MNNFTQDGKHLTIFIGLIPKSMAKITFPEYTQAKKLDNVLRYMERGGLPIYQTGLEIANGLKTPKGSQTELYLILNKLVKDEFIEYSKYFAGLVCVSMGIYARYHAPSFSHVP